MKTMLSLLFHWFNHTSINIKSKRIYFIPPPPPPHHVSRKHSADTITPHTILHTRDIDPAIYEIPLHTINKSLADDFPSLSSEKRRKSCSISPPPPPPLRYHSQDGNNVLQNARVRWHFTRVYTYYTSLDHRDFLLSGPHDLHPARPRLKMAE